MKINIIVKSALFTTIMAFGYNYGTYDDNLKNCKQGDPKACNDLAGMYLTGNKKYHIQADKTKAKKYYDRSIELYKKRCSGGDGKACFDLGDKYNGMRYGIDQDYSKMAKYYKQACDLQYGAACIELGAFYKRGIGVPMDQNISKDYYHKGVSFLNEECNKDIASSCDKLGYIYSLRMYDTNDTDKGKNMQQKAFMLYKDMCDDKNDSEGCFQVAFHYYSPRVLQLEKAKAYYHKSCLLGEDSACWREKELTPIGQKIYLHKVELQKIRSSILKKEAEEQDKIDRWKKAAKKVFEKPNLTRDELEKLYKEYRLEIDKKYNESKEAIEHYKKSLKVKIELIRNEIKELEKKKRKMYEHEKAGIKPDKR